MFQLKVRSYGICPSLPGLFHIVTIATGEWGGDIVRRGVCRSYYKGHKDKIQGEGRGGGGRWDWLGWGGGMGRKCRQL